MKALKIQKRTAIGKRNKALRRSGITPAVIYESKKESIIVQINTKELNYFLRDIQSKLVEIEYDDAKFPAIIGEIQHNPRLATISHISFNRINTLEEIRAEIQFELVGESEAVKIFKAILLTNTPSIEIKCLSKDLPDTIKVDVSILANIGESILVKDINLPSGVTLLHEDDGFKSVVSASAPQKDETTIESVAQTSEVPLSVERGKAQKPEL